MLILQNVNFEITNHNRSPVDQLMYLNKIVKFPKFILEHTIGAINDLQLIPHSSHYSDKCIAAVGLLIVFGMLDVPSPRVEWWKACDITLSNLISAASDLLPDVLRMNLCFLRVQSLNSLPGETEGSSNKDLGSYSFFKAASSRSIKPKLNQTGSEYISKTKSFRSILCSKSNSNMFNLRQIKTVEVELKSASSSEKTIRSDSTKRHLIEVQKALQICKDRRFIFGKTKSQRLISKSEFDNKLIPVTEQIIQENHSTNNSLAMDFAPKNVSGQSCQSKTDGISNHNFHSDDEHF